MTVTYLETLNREQRRAVEYGVRKNNAAPGAALLVIAGAGSGKTNTVAHRVAHLIVNGADPRRILLMTFSRRAAAEMTRRVERIARQVVGSRAGTMTDTATLVPLHENNNVYLVLDELATFGRVWRELSEEAANEQTVLKLIANGEFHRPVRVIVFNTDEGWSRDVTEDVAEALPEREATEWDLSQSARIFVGNVLNTGA